MVNLDTGGQIKSGCGSRLTMTEEKACWKLHWYFDGYYFFFFYPCDGVLPFFFWSADGVLLDAIYYGYVKLSWWIWYRMGTCLFDYCNCREYLVGSTCSALINLFNTRMWSGWGSIQNFVPWYIWTHSSICVVFPNANSAEICLGSELRTICQNFSSEILVDCRIRLVTYFCPD